MSDGISPLAKRPRSKRAASSKADELRKMVRTEDSDDFESSEESDSSESRSEDPEESDSSHDDSDSESMDEDEDVAVGYEEEAKKKKNCTKKAFKEVTRGLAAKPKAKPYAKTSDLQHANPSTTVLNYLREKNRPYNAAVLSSNLGGDIGMAKLKKILDEGVQCGFICECGETGKVYFPNQDDLPTLDDATLLSVRAEIQDCEASITALEGLSRALDASIIALELQPSDKELPEACRGLTESLGQGKIALSAYEAKLKQFQGDRPLILSELHAENEFYSKKSKALRERVREYLRNIAEGYEKDWRDIALEAGVILDD